MGRRLKKVLTTLHNVTSVAPVALSRTPAKGFRTGICRWARDFRCCIPATAQTTILHRALTQWRTNANRDLHFIRAQLRLREKLIIDPAFSAATCLTLIDIPRTCACIRVTRATTTNWLGNNAKTVATTVSTTRRGLFVCLFVLLWKPYRPRPHYRESK